ncbi:PREDICTED: catalase-like [Nanorana parkeri]|uniref:catalase-like n=1 Tax=Nanorana parkeri TaxID=125878 RepID=UPI0008549715|nr:PREDICTED: catalase-like [Nanorana parkeri]
MLTSSEGVPIGTLVSSLTVGPRGPILMQDAVLMEEMGHFVRERIPERVVHARGAGAFGYFEVTHNITHYCKACVFEYIGKKTPIAVRFSTTSGENGSSDLTREPRGYAVKFYTEQGNWDLVGNNSPVFFLRDPMLFPSLSHAQKRNPQTHLKDPNALWDFFSLRPETLHEVTMIFTDRGTPDGYRHMHGFGIHPFKMINARGKPVYCKFVYNTDQGIKNLTREQATALSGTNPEYAIKDLGDAISRGDFPSWTLYIQVMTFEEAKNMPFNPFDITKIWPHEEFPLLPVGKLILNRNPENYFAEVEQIAFCPQNLIPGIEPSPDRMLLGRMLAYPEALRYRLGSNYQQIPVNVSKQAKVANYHRDGFMAMGNNQGSGPNYYPNSFGGPEETREFLQSSFHLSGDVARYDDCKEDNVSQVRKFYLTVLDSAERQTLSQNIAKSLVGAQPFIQQRAVKNFTDVHPDYGARVLAELEKLRAAKEVK